MIGMPTMMSVPLRATATMLLAGVSLLAGCATQRLDTTQLEAAIERFERAAVEAEAAARQAEASARQAELAAQAAAADTGASRDRSGYERCATAASGGVESAAQADGVAARFTRCLGLKWGEPTATAMVQRERRAWDVYRVEFGDPARTVVVAVADSRADLASR
jgi:hypothetical protein